MANVLAINPLVIDTPGAGDILAAAAPIMIVGIRWDPGSAAVSADRAVVTDSAGNEVWASTTMTTYLGMPDYQPFTRPLAVKGLKVPTLAHGKLYIYLAP